MWWATPQWLPVCETPWHTSLERSIPLRLDKLSDWVLIDRIRQNDNVSFSRLRYEKLMTAGFLSLCLCLPLSLCACLCFSLCLLVFVYLCIYVSVCLFSLLPLSGCLLFLSLWSHVLEKICHILLAALWGPSSSSPHNFSLWTDTIEMPVKTESCQ